MKFEQGVWAAESTAKPNIILILTDDQRLEDCAHMPVLQKLLIQNGISFQNYFCNVSMCCPSRTSILRGQYAHNTGVLTNGGINGGFSAVSKFNIEESNIGIWLHNSGYKTALIGKYLNGYPGHKGTDYIPPGWDYWASCVKGNPYLQYNYTLNENGKLVEYGNAANDYGTDVYTRKTVNFINHSINQPFFIYLAFYAPHAPSTPAQRHLNLFQDLKIPRTKAFNEVDLSDKPEYLQKLPLLNPKQIEKSDAYYRKRLCALQAVDEAVQSIYDTLKQNNQLENTYIFFSTDNGYHIGEHRMLRGKQTPYESDIHLPLVVRGPDIVHGSKTSQLSGNIDLAPTFASLAGATVPNFVDGRSLVEILKGKAPDDWRKVFLVEHWKQEGKNLNAKELFHKVQMRSGGLELGHIPEYDALRHTDSIFVKYITGEQEYYDLKTDPDEIDNLAEKISTKTIISETNLINKISKSAAKMSRQLDNR